MNTSLRAWMAYLLIVVVAVLYAGTTEAPPRRESRDVALKPSATQTAPSTTLHRMATQRTRALDAGMRNAAYTVGE